MDERRQQQPTNLRNNINRKHKRMPLQLYSNYRRYYIATSNIILLSNLSKRNRNSFKLNGRANTMRETVTIWLVNAECILFHPVFNGIPARTRRRTRLHHSAQQTRTTTDHTL